jgi:acyl dehydratase
MAIDFEKLLALEIPEVVQSYTERDVIIYALGVGLGYRPLNERALRFVYEKNLQVLPTMPLVVGHPGFWMRDLPTGIDFTKIVHAEQAIELHRSMAPSGKVIGKTKVTDIIDKGVGRGAIVTFERHLYEFDSRELIAIMRQSNFCRADGGFSGPTKEVVKPSDFPGVAPHFVVDLPTRPETALLYRLSADLNPLHIDPKVASAAGFACPILHGMASFAIAGHAILQSVCRYDGARLKALSSRFTSPVIPGETLRTEIWRDRDELRFRCIVLERGIIALNYGMATVTADR